MKKTICSLILGVSFLTSCGGSEKIADVSPSNFKDAISDAGISDQEKVSFLEAERARIIAQLKDLNKDVPDFITHSLATYKEKENLKNLCHLTDFKVDQLPMNEIKITFEFDFDNKFDKNKKPSYVLVAYGYKGDNGLNEFSSKLRINESGTKRFRLPINIAITHNGSDRVSRYINDVLYKRFTDPEVAGKEVKKELERGFWIQPIEIVFEDGYTVSMPVEN